MNRPPTRAAGTTKARVRRFGLVAGSNRPLDPPTSRPTGLGVAFRSMPDDVPKVPSVGELMSAPVVTALPDETVAEAATRMRDRKVGSVVVVDGDRTVGILTERDLVRWGAAGVDPGASKVAEWMTEDPDCVAPISGCRRRTTRSGRTATATSPSSTTAVSSASSRCATSSGSPRSSPSSTRRRSRRRPGLEGVIVADTTVGDVRGLEGFYHYREYSAVELADKRRLEDVWFLLFEGHLPSAAERESFLDEVAGVPRLARARLPPRCRSSPAARRRSWRACAPRSRSSVPSRATGRPSTSTTPSAAATPCRCARRCRPSSPPSTGSSGSWSPSRRGPTSATAPTTCG